MAKVIKKTGERKRERETLNVNQPLFSEFNIYPLPSCPDRESAGCVHYCTGLDSNYVVLR